MEPPQAEQMGRKREAVTKAKASGNVSQTARELGISNKSLHAWIKAHTVSR